MLLLDQQMLEEHIWKCELNLVIIKQSMFLILWPDYKLLFPLLSQQMCISLVQEKVNKFVFTLMKSPEKSNISSMKHDCGVTSVLCTNYSFEIGASAHFPCGR